MKITNVVSSDSIAPDKSISFYPVPVKEYAFVNFKDLVDAEVEV